MANRLRCALAGSYLVVAAVTVLLVWLALAVPYDRQPQNPAATRQRQSDAVLDAPGKGPVME